MCLRVHHQSPAGVAASAFLAPVSQEANPTSNGFEVPFHLSDCLEGHETSGLKLPKSKPQTCHTQNPQRCGNHQSCDGETEPVINESCLLYTSDAADDLTRVDLGGRR